ncbi:unnamed protein product, partial [marine sediment metagenome]
MRKIALLLLTLLAAGFAVGDNQGIGLPWNTPNMIITTTNADSLGGVIADSFPRLSLGNHFTGQDTFGDTLWVITDTATRGLKIYTRNSAGYPQGDSNPIAIVRNGWGMLELKNVHLPSPYTQWEAFDSTMTAIAVELGQEGWSLHLKPPLYPYGSMDTMVVLVDPFGRLLVGNTRRYAVGTEDPNSIKLDVEGKARIDDTLWQRGELQCSLDITFSASRDNAIKTDPSTFVVAGRDLDISAGSATDVGGTGWTSLGNTTYWGGGMVEGADGDLYALTTIGDSVWKSTDGGAAWTKLGPNTTHYGI